MERTRRKHAESTQKTRRKHAENTQKTRREPAENNHFSASTHVPRRRLLNVLYLFLLQRYLIQKSLQCPIYTSYPIHYSICANLECHLNASLPAHALSVPGMHCHRSISCRAHKSSLGSARFNERPRLFGSPANFHSSDRIIFRCGSISSTYPGFGWKTSITTCDRVRQPPSPLLI